jgi:hypothetical protein
MAMACLSLLLHAAAAATTLPGLPGLPPPRVTRAPGVSNVPILPAGGGGLQWPPPAPLSNVVKRFGLATTPDQCAAACVAYRNKDVSPVSGWSRCNSFTFFANGSGCFGRVDSLWAPEKLEGASSGQLAWPPRPCAGVRDCSHNGRCEHGLCACEAAWGGDRCQTLRVLPAVSAQQCILGGGGHAGEARAGVETAEHSARAALTGGSSLTMLLQVRSSGLRAVDGGANTSTWGGAVTRADDGSYHMFASEMMEHCGIGAWTANSHVVHAVSASPGGTYRRLPAAQGREVWPVFSHEPNLARAPSGEYHLPVCVSPASRPTMRNPGLTETCLWF